MTTKTPQVDQLGQPEPFTWNVRTNRFPWGIGEVIGTVDAHYKPTALSLAQQQFGNNVVVERVFTNVKIAEARNG